MICTKCKIEKETESFSWQKKHGKYHAWCKPCMKEKRMQYYYADKKAQYRYEIKRRKNIREFVNNLKRKLYCIVCRENNECCLDFHHINSNTKRFEISNADKYVGLRGLKKELLKCVILCSNCHRKVHANVMVLGSDGKTSALHAEIYGSIP